MFTDVKPLWDAILIEFTPKDAASPEIAAALARVHAKLGLPLDQQACQALGEPRVTDYLRGLPSDSFEKVMAVVHAELAAVADGEPEISRLATVRVYTGASSTATAHYHYVVRTDVAPGGEEELERWYDEEHMPSLAAVPGVVLAQRLVSLDAAPRYYACYDLVSPEVLLSREWLAVRETDWSGRVRPTFRSTRRIVSRRLGPVKP